jgi:hypothetical protein
MVRHGSTWFDLHGSTWFDMVRHGSTWFDSSAKAGISSEFIGLLFLDAKTVCLLAPIGGFTISNTQKTRSETPNAIY